MSELKLSTDREKCDCCNLPTVHSAITVNNVSFCHTCLEFLKTISELNRSEWLQEVEKQSKYIENEKSKA